MVLDEHPAAKGEYAFSPGPLCQVRCRRVKYCFKLVQQPAPVKPLGGLVAGKIGLVEKLHITRIVTIQFDYFFDQAVKVWKIGCIDETGRVEVLAHAPVAPVNGQCAGHHGLGKFFSRVAWKAGVFKGDVEFVIPHEIDLAGKAPAHRPADIVHKPSARINALVFGQLLKYFQTVAVAPSAVAADHVRAKLGLFGQNLLWCRKILSLNQRRGRIVHHGVPGQTQMPRIIDVKRGESEIAFSEIRRDGLVRVVDFDAVKMPVNMAVVAVNKKIGAIADCQLKPFAQEVEKEIVMLIQVFPEIAEIEPNPSLHRESIEGYRQMATVFSGLGTEIIFSIQSMKILFDGIHVMHEEPGGGRFKSLLINALHKCRAP